MTVQTQFSKKKICLEVFHKFDIILHISDCPFQLVQNNFYKIININMSMYNFFTNMWENF